MEHDMSSKILSTVWIGDTEKDAQEFQWLLATLGEARMQTGIQCEVIPVQPSETGNFVIAQLMRGMAQTRGDLLFFVDAHVLPSASCVTQLLHALTAERAGGVAAPAAFRSAFSAPRRMPRYHDFGSLWAFCRELEAVGDSPEPAIILDSGCFLLGRAVFEEAGGLDARFLTMHYALADLSLRLLQAGRPPVFVPSAYVHENREHTMEDYQADIDWFHAKHGFNYLYSCNTRRDLLRHVRISADHPAVLEIGCACGGNLLQIGAQHPEVELYGIELSDEAAAVARQFAQVFAIDVEDFHQPAWADKFDDVIMGDLLEHLRDPWQTMQGIYHITRPGGRVIISVPNVMNLRNFEKMLREGDWPYEDQGLRDRTHLRFFTKKTAEELVAQAGYHVTVVAPQVFRSTPELDQLRAELRPLLGDGVGVENLDAYQWVVVGEKR